MMPAPTTIMAFGMERFPGSARNARQFQENGLRLERFLDNGTSVDAFSSVRRPEQVTRHEDQAPLIVGMIEEKLAAQAAAVEPGHPQIAEDDVEPSVGNPGQRLEPMLCMFDLVAGA